MSESGTLNRLNSVIGLDMLRALKIDDHRERCELLKEYPAPDWG